MDRREKAGCLKSQYGRMILSRPAIILMPVNAAQLQADRLSNTAARTEASWQIESKDYQFWIQGDSDGNFAMKNVIPGVYGLHGWVPGFIGDYLDKELVTISSGSQTQLGNLIYAPVREGPTVWEIGYPDRTAIGYYVPDVNPMYVNKLFVNSPEKYRQYGLWDRYTDIHPESDQVFTIDISDPKKDWFFAHLDRRGSDKYLPSTWKINFNLNSVTSGRSKLKLAPASATRSDLQVHVNYMDIEHLVFQARGGDALGGILYDYIRLEAPVTSTRFEH